MRRNGMMWAAIVLLASLGPKVSLASGTAAATAPATDARGEYGVNLAISGEEARAESLFITMLSHTHGDASALNNLGNIRLLRGETGVALAFYDRALRGDSLDPGIHLNRATALMLLGDPERSQKSFATGVKLAGGVANAEALLGLPPAQAPTEKAAKKSMIDPEQVRAMLRHAATTVPTDSVQAVNASSKTASKPQSAWRSAGPRGSDGSDTSHLLYWKH